MVSERQRKKCSKHFLLQCTCMHSRSGVLHLLSCSTCVTIAVDVNLSKISNEITAMRKLILVHNFSLNWHFGKSKNFNSSVIFEMKLVAYQHELKKFGAFQMISEGYLKNQESTLLKLFLS